MARPMVVCVTGASGFIASHIVKQMLEKGHTVRGTVRDALDRSFDEAIRGCHGVFHAASPLVPGKGVEDPETLVLRPAVEGTLNVLRSCKKAGSVQSLVVTSSMSAVAPNPEPPVKSEEHWSDPEEQKARGSFYGASKTLAERAAYDFVAKEMPGTRLATICPTMVLGPMLQPEVNMTMGSFRSLGCIVGLGRWQFGVNWLVNGVAGPDGKCRNDSMSFVDVRDCAAQHVAAMELEKEGRFMSLDRSLHWNDLALLMKDAELYPAMPSAEPFDGELCKVTEFDRTRQESLGVPVRKIPEILTDAADELKRRGELP
eukprot:s900_g7.t1